VPDVPEGFEGAHDAAGDDVPPPPPPPSGQRPRGGITVSGVPASAGGAKFQFNWRAALTALGGLAIIAFGVFEFVMITHKEQAGEKVVFTGRRSGWLTLIYGIAGRWGVLGVFALVGLSMVAGAVLVMLGKRQPKEH
jgi:hypothetical protein